ncbi:MAG: hypothetical protein UMU75_10865 [Halomonas sp.]|nr:hypothetical protein [Halomonas sp.]
MCHAYATTDTRRFESTTRSVPLQGSVTRVRLVNESWVILEGLASASRRRA